jgi:hypothetical protein
VLKLLAQGLNGGPRQRLELSRRAAHALPIARSRYRIRSVRDKDEAVKSAETA